MFSGVSSFPDLKQKYDEPSHATEYQYISIFSARSAQSSIPVILLINFNYITVNNPITSQKALKWIDYIYSTRM